MTYAKFGTILLITILCGGILGAGILFAYTNKSPEELLEKNNLEQVKKHRDKIVECEKSATGSSREILEKLDACKDLQKPKLQMIISYSGSIEGVSKGNNNVEKSTATGSVIPEASQNLRKKFGLENCRFINEDHKLPKYNLEWIAYDIACEKGKSFDVRSPGEYTIEKIGYGTNLGNYIILIKSSNIGDIKARIVLGHTVTDRREGDYLGEGDIIGQTNLSGESTGIHVHIELWEGSSIVNREYILGTTYQSIDQTALLNHRNWNFGQNKYTYYFTSYNLGDVKQNDNSPCVGASGKNLCELEKKGIRTMALTSDIRSILGIKFGDRVQLLGEKGCEGTYQVEDEMNIRFRQTPGILRPNTPFYIKGDIPSKEGGVCSIIKL